MILRSRSYQREEPSREAKSIYIFAEGAKREYQYFRYFKEIDTRINIEIYKLDDQEDNSPGGLLEIAEKCILPKSGDPAPKYTFQENDEVWIVLDIDRDKLDSRAPQIEKILAACKERQGWFIARSNPCFEVWLYYHFSAQKPVFRGDECSSKWKEFVNKISGGGFDSRKHPIYIEQASVNAEKNFQLEDEKPNLGSTEVFKLAKTIYSIVKAKIRKALKSE